MTNITDITGSLTESADQVEQSTGARPTRAVVGKDVARAFRALGRNGVPVLRMIEGYPEPMILLGWVNGIEVLTSLENA